MRRPFHRRDGHRTGRPPTTADATHDGTALKLLIGNRFRAVGVLCAISICAGLAEAGILTVAAQCAASLVAGTRTVHVHLGFASYHWPIAKLLLTALGLALFRLALQLPMAWIPASLVSDSQASMRRQGFFAFTTASWAAQSEDLLGHFQELMTNQVTQASQGAVHLTNLILAGATFGVLLLAAFATNPLAATFMIATAAVLFLLLRPLNKLSQRSARKLSAAHLEYAGAVGEAVDVAEEMHVFGTAAAQRQRVARLVDEAQRLFLRSQFLIRVIPGVYQSLIYAILVLGLLAASATHGPLPTVGAVVLMVVRAGTYGQQLQSSYLAVRQTLPFVERVHAATAAYARAREQTGSAELPEVRSLSFSSVSFSYAPSRPVLSEISFRVSAGEAVGIIGPSGGGKSTLTQLLLRLRPPDGGQYCVNDLPADQCRDADWVRRFAYVSQQPRLVRASVADNVRLWRPISDERVERACRLANIHDDVISWSQGYRTIIGPRAGAISGGQAQRICLARALAAEPDVLVLDEPTSALDSSSEALVQASLTALHGSLTIFIVTHRLSTLSMCDRVMVLIAGRLDAFDSVASLQDENEYFRRAATLAHRDNAAPGTRQ